MSFARGHTRASAMAHNHVSQAEFNKSYQIAADSNLFKMSKFKNIKPRTDTNNRPKTVTGARK